MEKPSEQKIKKEIEDIYSNVLFVADLPNETTNEDLQNIFQEFHFQFASLNTFKNNNTWAQVYLENKEWADKARHELNGYILKPINSTNETKIKPIRICKYEGKGSNKQTNIKQSLLIKNIDINMTQKEFYNIFLEYGDIVSGKIEYDENGVSKGYGYIYYYTEESAEEAKKNLNGKSFWGKNIEIVNLIPTKKNRSNNITLFVLNIPKDITEEKLNSIFGKFGPVTNISINPNGFAYISYNNFDSASKCLNQMKADPISFPGLPSIVVKFARTKEERESNKNNMGNNIEKNDLNYASLNIQFNYLYYNDEIKTDMDLDKEIRLFIKVILLMDYRPKEVLVDLETMSGLVTFDNYKDYNLFFLKYQEFCSKQAPVFECLPYETPINNDEQNNNNNFIGPQNLNMNPMFNPGNNNNQTPFNQSQNNFRMMNNNMSRRNNNFPNMNMNMGNMGMPIPNNNMMMNPNNFNNMNNFNNNNTMNNAFNYMNNPMQKDNRFMGNNNNNNFKYNRNFNNNNNNNNNRSGQFINYNINRNKFNNGNNNNNNEQSKDNNFNNNNPKNIIRRPNMPYNNNNFNNNNQKFIFRQNYGNSYNININMNPNMMPINPLLQQQMMMLASQNNQKFNNYRLNNMQNQMNNFQNMNSNKTPGEKMNNNWFNNNNMMNNQNNFRNDLNDGQKNDIDLIDQRNLQNLNPSQLLSQFNKPPINVYGPNMLNSEEQEDLVNEIADSIYEIVYAKYPNEASKITGMIKEKGYEKMNMLLSKQEDLNEIIDKAYEMIKNNKNNAKTENSNQ